MKCEECQDLKKWYHGQHSPCGMFSYTCGRSGLHIEDLEQGGCVTISRTFVLGGGDRR